MCRRRTPLASSSSASLAPRAARFPAAADRAVLAPSSSSSSYTPTPDESLSSLDRPAPASASSSAAVLYTDGPLAALGAPPRDVSYPSVPSVRPVSGPAKVDTAAPYTDSLYSGSVVSRCAISSSASSSVGGAPLAPIVLARKAPLPRARLRRPRSPTPSAAPDANASAPPPLKRSRCLRSWFVTSDPDHLASAIASHSACSVTRSSLTSIAAAVSRSSARDSISWGSVPLVISLTIDRSWSARSCSPDSSDPASARAVAVEARLPPAVTTESPITSPPADCFALTTAAASMLPSAVDASSTSAPTSSSCRSSSLRLPLRLFRRRSAMEGRRQGGAGTASHRASHGHAKAGCRRTRAA